MYRSGEFTEALSALEETGERSGGMVFLPLARAHILAGQSGDGLADAHEALNVVEDPDGLFAVFKPATLCLLGDKPGAREFALEVEDVPPWRDGWYRRLHEYNRGELDEEALLRLAGNSMWNQCEAHYFVALNLLAEGDPDGACKHFQKSVDTHVYHYFAYQWSRAFLTRMQDPRWPSWIK